MESARYRYRKPLEKLEKSVPAHYYYDADHYQRELEAFWYNMWIEVARVEEVSSPRDYKVVTIGDQNVVITRDLKGNLRAFHNTCRHRGSILCTDIQGKFEGGSIVCPYHAWTYSLEGDLIATPHQLESADFDMADYSLYDVAIGTWGGYIFVNLAGKDAEPLEMALGEAPRQFVNYHMEDLRLGKRIVIDVEANWKLLFENFRECYHCPTVHPEFCSIVTRAQEGGAWRLRYDEDGQAYPEIRGGEYLPGAKTLTLDGTSNLRPFPGLTEDEVNRVYTGSVIPPNVFLNIHPDYINSHTMFPLGPTTVRMVYDWLFEPASMEQPDFDLDHYVEAWDITNRQDARNTEWQQSGVRSREFKHGTFVPQEGGCHWINQWVLKHLGEAEGDMSQSALHEERITVGSTNMGM